MSLVYITHHDENILECEQDFVKAAGPKTSIFCYKNRKKLGLKRGHLNQTKLCHSLPSHCGEGRQVCV